MEKWAQLNKNLIPKTYKCGFCDTKITSINGYFVDNNNVIYICPCNKPTYFEYGEQTPTPLLGNYVANLPSDISDLYYEIRKCTTIKAYTGIVLLCRKLLMNIAVKEGADEGKKFVEYVKYLLDNFINYHNKPWIDHIRKKGNEATHEIPSVDKETALELIDLSEMVLKIIYEFPTRHTKNKKKQDETKNKDFIIKPQP